METKQPFTLPPNHKNVILIGETTSPVVDASSPVFGTDRSWFGLHSFGINFRQTSLLPSGTMEQVSGLSMERLPVEPSRAFERNHNNMT